MMTTSSAKQVMDTLELRFGNPDVIMHKIASDLKHLPKIASRQIDLVTLATTLKNEVAAMEAIKHTGYLHNPELINIIGKIPSAMIYNYNRYLYDNPSSEPRLKIISNFLYREAEMACKAGTNFSAEKPTNKDKDQHRSKYRKPEERRKSFTVAQMNFAESMIKRVPSPRKRREAKCGFCQRKSHTVIECHHFAKLPGKDRWKWAAESRVCYRCLLGRHRYHQCKVAGCKQDPACRERHNKLLHDKGQLQQKSQTKNLDMGKTTVGNVESRKSSD